MTTQLLSAEQAAKMLNTSTRTVLRLIVRGEIPATRLTDTSPWRIDIRDLEDYAQRRGIKLEQ